MVETSPNPASLLFLPYIQPFFVSLTYSVLYLLDRISPSLPPKHCILDDRLHTRFVRRPHISGTMSKSNRGPSGSNHQRSSQNNNQNARRTNKPKNNQQSSDRTNAHGNKLDHNQSSTESATHFQWCSSCRVYSSDAKHKNEQSWQCPQNPKRAPNNQSTQSNPSNQSKQTNQSDQTKCDMCNKSGHTAEQCYRNKGTNARGRVDNQKAYNDLQVEQYYETKRDYKSADDKYCVYCNQTGHLGKNCNDTRKVMEYKESILLCRLDGCKGHLADDCRCPLARRCEKCTKPGHTADTCKVVPDADVYSVFTNKILLQQDHAGQRFKWNNGHILPNTAQALRQQWEAYQLQELQAGHMISKEEERKVLGEIEDMEKAIFNLPGAAESGYTYSAPAPAPWLPRSSGSSSNSFDLTTSPSRYSYRSGSIIKNRPASASSSYKPSIPIPGILHQGPTQNYKINRFLTQGMTPEDIIRLEEASFKVQEERLNAATKRIRAKITVSRHLYLHEHVTVHLQRQISQGQFTGGQAWNVHIAMAQGALFYRDPKAMEALFARQVPRCGTCHTEGKIFDCNFDYIHPATSASELLEVRDEEKWGIFVGFDCDGRCSKNGYWFHDAYEYNFADVDVTDPEYQKW